MCGYTYVYRYTGYLLACLSSPVFSKQTVLVLREGASACSKQIPKRWVPDFKFTRVEEFLPSHKVWHTVYCVVSTPQSLNCVEPSSLPAWPASFTRFTCAFQIQLLVDRELQMLIPSLPFLDFKKSPAKVPHISHTLNMNNAKAPSLEKKIPRSIEKNPN